MKRWPGKPKIKPRKKSNVHYLQTVRNDLTPEELLVEALGYVRSEGKGLQELLMCGYDAKGYFWCRSSKGVTREVGLMLCQMSIDWTMNKTRYAFWHDYHEEEEDEG